MAGSESKRADTPAATTAAAAAAAATVDSSLHSPGRPSMAEVPRDASSGDTLPSQQVRTELRPPRKRWHGVLSEEICMRQGG